MKKTTFKYAVPVWITGEEKEMNVSLRLEAKVKKGGVLLRIAGHSLYQVFVNGRLAAQGPARAGHGFHRVDEIDLDGKCTGETNEISVVAAGYNVNSFYLTDEPSFICAELYCGGELAAATGKSGFSYVRFTDRIRKVQRYSYQRPFSEAYSLPAKRTAVTVSETEKKEFIEREVPYPEYEKSPFVSVISKGSFCHRDREKYFGDRAVTGISDTLKGFRQEDLELFACREAERLDFSMSSASAPAGDIFLGKNGAAIADLGKELTGFFDLDVETSGGRLFIMFDEILSEGDVNFERLTTCSVIIYDLAPGKYHLTSFEPYSARYVKLASEASGTRVTGLSMIRFEFPSADILPPPSFGGDAELAAIYDAAVSTFRQNTVDIFMDCPSRERAGWLCDSFFTARTERALTGKSTVEKCFLENFLMPESFYAIPEGMLPMCYPSDHYNGSHIPNWAMWYVIELYEYLGRTGDSELVLRAKEKVFALLGYFRRFENEEGLLDRLPGWVFVEWSKSNELVQHINYPTNMLYSLFKRCIAKLYGKPELEKEADDLAETVRKRSFTGKWFCDNSVHTPSGETALSGMCTESCQYYAFFTGVATKERYPELWNTLVNDFGPQRKKTGAHGEVFFANAFIGNYLRLELLFREGMYGKVMENVRGYFGYMAERTGTLWENDTPFASCNHGFASHTAVWMREIYK